MAGGNSRGPAVVAGNPEKSPVIRLLRGQIAPKMPLGKALPDTEIAVIEKWIRELKPRPGRPNFEPKVLGLCEAGKA